MDITTVFGTVVGGSNPSGCTVKTKLGNTKCCRAIVFCTWKDSKRGVREAVMLLYAEHLRLFAVIGTGEVDDGAAGHMAVSVSGVEVVARGAVQLQFPRSFNLPDVNRRSTVLISCQINDRIIV